MNIIDRLDHELHDGRSRFERGMTIGLGIALAMAGVGAVAARRSQRKALPAKGVTAANQITIDRPIEDVYAFWRDLANLPRFMTHLESVQVVGARHAHVRAKPMGGHGLEWDAELVEDRPNEKLAWRASEGGPIRGEGAATFRRAPGGRGTEVRVELSFQPPGGAIGVALAKLFGKAPGLVIGTQLRRLKQLLEIGEITRSDASVHEGPHPAQPSGEAPPIAATTSLEGGRS